MTTVYRPDFEFRGKVRNDVEAVAFIAAAIVYLADVIAAAKGVATEQAVWGVER